MNRSRAPRPRRRPGLRCAVAALLLLLAQSPASAGILSATVQAPDSVSYAVYSALINQHYDRGADYPLIVLDESVNFPEDAKLDDNYRSMLQAALSPLSYETYLAFRESQDQPAQFRPGFTCRRPYEMVGRSALDSLFAVCPGGWDRFAEAYPTARGYITFSPVALDPTGNEALVYTEEHCGDRCGEGTFAFLRHEDEGWKVVKKLTVWAS